MGLKDILLRHNVPLPDDFDKRLDIVIAGLKNKLSFKKKLRDYAKQNGGFDMRLPTIPVMSGAQKTQEPEDPNNPKPPQVVPDPEDYLGPRLRWFINVVTSPYARTALQGVFMVAFFLNYLERIPIFGSILSASLDVILAGGKVLTKTIQNTLPTMLSLIPLPYMNIVGMSLASIFGFIVWPIVAMVSFSRKDFVSSIESLIRVIPYSVGDVIANNFLEANRTVARLDEKRIKLGNDISNVFQQMSSIAENVSAQMKEGLKQLADKTKEAGQKGTNAIQNLRSSMPALPMAPPPPPAPLPEPMAPPPPPAPLPEPIAPPTPAVTPLRQLAGTTRKAKRRLHRRTPKNKKWSRKQTRPIKSRKH
jgi:hypothetical protein